MEKFLQGLVADIVMSSSKSPCSDESLVDGSDVGGGGSKKNRTDCDDDLLQVPSSSPETVEIVSDNHKSHRWTFARSVSRSSDSSISSCSTPTQNPESNMIGVSSSSTPSPTSTVVIDWRDARFMNNATKIIMPSTISSPLVSSSSVSSSSAPSGVNAVSMSPQRRSFDPRKHLPPQLPKRHCPSSVSSSPEPLRLVQDGRAQSTPTMCDPLQAQTSTRTSSSLSSSIRNPRNAYRRSMSDLDVSDHSKGESRWSAHSVPTHSSSWSPTTSSPSSSNVRRKNVKFVDINGKRRMDRDCLLPSPRRSPEPQADTCCDDSDGKVEILTPSTSSTAARNFTVIADRSSSPRMKALAKSVEEYATLSGPMTDKQEAKETHSPSTTPICLYDVLPDGQRMPTLNHKDEMVHCSSGIMLQRC